MIPLAIVLLSIATFDLLVWAFVYKRSGEDTWGVIYANLTVAIINIIGVIIVNVARLVLLNG